MNKSWSPRIIETARALDANMIKGINPRGYFEKKRRNIINIPNVAGTLTGGGHSGGLHSDMTVIPVRAPLKFLNRNQKNITGEYAYTNE